MLLYRQRIGETLILWCYTAVRVFPSEENVINRSELRQQAEGTVGSWSCQALSLLSDFDRRTHTTCIPAVRATLGDNCRHRALVWHIVKGLWSEVCCCSDGRGCRTCSKDSGGSLHEIVLTPMPPWLTIAPNLPHPLCDPFSYIGTSCRVSSALTLPHLPPGSLDNLLLDPDTPADLFTTQDGGQREDPGDGYGGRAAFTSGAFSRPSIKYRIECIDIFIFVDNSTQGITRYRVPVPSDDSSSRALCLSPFKTGLPGSVLLSQLIPYSVK